MWTGDLLNRLIPDGSRRGPIAQAINRWVHREPFRTIAHHLFWGFVLILVAPVLGSFTLVAGAWQLVRQQIRVLVRGEFRPTIDPVSLRSPRGGGEGLELAVLVTGCDTGLGRQLALKLAQHGFTVFAGCYRNPAKQKEKLFADDERIRPIWMDVTNQDHVDKACQTVSKWLDGGGTNEKRRRRHFYALLNNAGIAKGGYVDWCSLSDYEVCLEVNCLGQIRTCKAFYEIFQKQAIERKTAARANDPVAMRIVNVNSMAGQLPSGCFASTPYEVSKNASVSFTDGLRIEAKAWGVDVVSVDPSFHETPMADAGAIRETMQRKWDEMPAEQRDRYGKEFLDRYVGFVGKGVTSATWDAEYLVETIVDRCLLSKASPPAQVSVGIDAKFVMMPMRMVPRSVIQGCFLRWIMPPQTPAALLTPPSKAEPNAATKTTKTS